MGGRITYGLGIVALVAGVLWLGSRVDSIAPTMVREAKSRAPAELSQRKTAMDSGTPSNSSAGDAVATFAGFPSDTTTDPQNRYAFAKNCAKFRQFDAFYKAQAAADPNWPLTNPRAMNALNPEMRAKLQGNSRFLSEHRKLCEPWLKSTPHDLANAQIYEASLQAALNGNKDAAACFIMAPWQKPDEFSPYYADLMQKYAGNAGRFLQEGLRAGSWPIVLAAYQASLEEHGLQTQAGFSDKNSYLITRLAQQGSPSGADEAQLGYEAAKRSRSLSAAEMVKLDESALELFTNQFRRRKVSVQSVTDMCAN